MGKDDDDDYVSEGDRLADQYGVWVYLLGFERTTGGLTRIYFSVATDEKDAEINYVYASTGIVNVGKTRYFEKYKHEAPKWLPVNPAATIESFAGPARLSWVPYSATTVHMTLNIGSFPAVKFHHIEFNSMVERHEEAGRVQRSLEALAESFVPAILKR